MAAIIRVATVSIKIRLFRMSIEKAKSAVKKRGGSEGGSMRLRVR